MAIDMNADVGELIKGLFSSGNSGKKNPYSKLILSGVVLLLVATLYVTLVFLPTKKELLIKANQLAGIEYLKKDIQGLSRKIKVAAKELEAAQLQYEQMTKLFHTSKELEDLYQHISMLALTHQLTITKLEKAGEEPIFEQSSANKNKTNNQQQKKRVAFYKFKVKFNIMGNYAGYTLFRRDLAKLKKTINIDKETIRVAEIGTDSKKQYGVVIVAATLSTYRMPVTDKEKYVSRR